MDSPQPSPSRHKPIQPKEAWDKLIAASDVLKLLGSLSNGEAVRVTDAVKVLGVAQTSPRHRKYKQFLSSVLNVSGPQGLLLCAVGLGQVKAADMKISDRDALIKHIEANKNSDILSHSTLQCLASRYQIPNAVKNVLLLPDIVAHQPAKRKRGSRDKHSVDSLAEEYQVPSLDGLHNIAVDRRIAQVVGRFKRRAPEAGESYRPGTESQSRSTGHSVARRSPERTATAPSLRQHESARQSLSIDGLQNDPEISGEHDRLSSNPNFTSHQQHLVFEKASLQGITTVFDPYMCDAIRRDTPQSGDITCLKAAVTMDFPFEGLVDCLMSLAIHESKVEYLAMALFNVQVESVGHVRYVTLTGGARLISNAEVTLKGAQDNAIISVFGAEVYKAVAASRMRKRELEEGKEITEGVSMILSSTGEGAIINLSLGVKGGVQIRTKLYT